MTSESISPIFIFSLPRSGSTLLQRMLGAHPKIETVAEPWILLPSFYALKSSGVRAEYSHRNLSTAVREFCGELKNGRSDYRQATRDWALKLYEGTLEADVEYFIDKTPKYSLVAEEIMETFSKAKFIFLWRNPLAILASMMETWADGKWNLYYYEPDLYQGVQNLVNAAQRNSGASISLRYEDLVQSPEAEAIRILEFLGLNGAERVISDFGDVNLAGSMGDPKREAAEEINSNSIHGWREVLSNPVRKWWSSNYIEWIGKDRLSVMGYELESLQTQLREHPTGLNNTLSDIARVSYYAFRRRIFDRLHRRGRLKGSEDV